MQLKNLLKMAMVVILITASRGLGWGQVTINFDTPGNWIQGGSTALTSYGAHAYQESGVLIQGTNVLRNLTAAQDGFPGALGTYSMRVGNTAVSKVVITVSTGGVSTFSIKVRRWDNSPMPSYTVRYSVNDGTDWTSLTNIDGTLLTTSNFFTFEGTINSAVANVLIEIKNTGTTERIMLDDFTWTGFSGGGNQNPTITNIVQNPTTLIQYNNSVSVAATIADTDGTIANAELRWGNTALLLNNTIPMNLVQSSYTASIPAQANGTTVYYAIYAEDNEGGSATSATQNYSVSPVIYSETFDSDLGTCDTFSISGATKQWIQSAGAASMNGYNSGDLEEDWLFLPVQNLDAQDLLLSFDSWKRYGITDENNYLNLYYSKTYPGTGDPTPYTWYPLSFTQPSIDNSWTPSGTIDLSTLTGTAVYIGFKYRYAVGTYVSWSIDNIKLERKTYSVTFNVVDGTNPVGTDPIDAATVRFYNVDKLTNASGQVVYTQIENENNIAYLVTKEGYHNLSGTVNIDYKNRTHELKMFSSKVAVNVVATPAANTASISWDGDGAEEYRVLYYTDLQNSFIVYSTTKPVSIPVLPSTTYTVIVGSRVNGIWSLYSPSISFTSLAGTTEVAHNVQVSEVTSSTAQVNWDGSGAEQYAIYYYDINTSASYYVTSNASPTTINVSASTTYNLMVKSRIGGVWTAYTRPVQFTTPAGTQMLPTNVSVSNITSSSATINWIGEGAELYYIYYYDINSTVSNYVKVTSSPANIIVSPATTYRVMVRVRINGVWTSYTTPVQFVTPAGSQMLASNVVVNNITAVGADVSWDGSGAEKYQVLYYEVGTSNYNYVKTTASFVHLNLNPDTDYAVQVLTRINGQWSSYTESEFFTTLTLLKASPSFASQTSNVNVVPENVQVYPNPATDYTTLSLSLKESTDLTISIFDISGAIVKTEKFSNQLGQIEARISLNGIAKGMYVVKISTQGYVESKRLIIK